MIPGDDNLQASVRSKPPMADAGCFWDVEEAVTITGFSRTEILRVCAVVAGPAEEAAPRLDAATLRLLAELRRLREQCNLDGPGLEIVAGLLAELHALRRELLRRR